MGFGKRCLVLAAIIPMVFASGCNDEFNPLGNDSVAGEYVGSFNVSDPSYQNTSYKVDVTWVSDNRLRISPSTSHGTEWEVTVMKVGASLYTCVNCTDNQVTVNIGDNSTHLNYNFGGNNEQFSGTKQ